MKVQTDTQTDVEADVEAAPEAHLRAMGEAWTMDLDDGAMLVFGMRWFPLVGSRPDTLARRRAREARATHYVHGGTRAAAVGCTRLRCRPRPCHSAAQAFAQSFPQGLAAGMLTMTAGQAWLVATQDGAVMARTDRVYAHRDQALAELEQFYPGLASAMHLLDLAALAANLGPSTTLWRLSPWVGLAPAGARGCGVLLAAGLVAGAAWQAWRLWRPPATPAARALDPLAAWQAALARQAAALPLHDAAWLGRVFLSLRQLPIHARGWRLASARCAAQASGWRCEARYRRLGPGGTNQTFADAPPARGQAGFDGPHFEGLDDARVAWRVAAGPGAGVDVDALSRRQAGDIRLGSLLQTLQPAFGSLTLGAAAALPLTPPLDEAGLPLPRPAGLPVLYSRPVLLHGPLRSYALFQAPPAKAAWQEVTLALTPGRRAEAAGSVLTARLQGVVYEKD
ncbi:type 4b pilus protein PilO2 [Achromobacter aloeverae]|uniref:Type 4b pilus protein PilO2 n=1 Tax=Achromobacter aloeverae TaxID=1750518 RepID=A0A4Q1HPK3_9BURK|nr:type 4b pilus protein PilO2 [Achromobacter aloeverae]RXN92982.1 hypothetical protein C7R54_04430 [Achromobacter aloeverae]